MEDVVLNRAGILGLCTIIVSTITELNKGIPNKKLFWSTAAISHRLLCHDKEQQNLGDINDIKRRKSSALLAFRRAKYKIQLV